MAAVKIEGLTKLHREAKLLDRELPKELKKISKEGAEIVLAEAAQIGPRRSGKLLGTLKPGATTKGAYVKAGPLVYARPIHFGWPAHNIEPQPFLYDAADARRADVIEAFERGLAELVDRSFTRGTD